MAKNKIQESFLIETDHRDWLNSMAAAYHLPDASKALRVLLDYAMEEGDRNQIFAAIRCRHCG